jgi:hypothetical protein
MQDTQNVENSGQTYSTPLGGAPKKATNKWLYIFLGLLLLGGFGIFMFTRSGGTAEPTASPSFGVVPVDEFPETTPEATATAEPIDKEDVKIEVQNGTGTAGDAAFVQTKLKALGYSDISVGNADNTDYTDTMVTFSKETPTTVQDEIKAELEKYYKKVVVKTSSTQKSNVVIITGVKSGSTARPAGTTRASSTPRASGSPSSRTPTPTPTKSPSPTPAQ